MHGVKVGLVQIVEPMLESLCIPYALGLLESYARAHLPPAALQRLSFLPYVFERVPLAQRQAQWASLQHAQIVGFSVYTWNEQYSLALARALKTACPEILIVFGGPQVPDQADAYLREHPFVDVCCHGPGEGVFSELLLRVLDQAHFSDLQAHLRADPPAGTSVRGPGTQVFSAPPPPREQHLDRIPSPYLTGCFDEVLARCPQHRWVALWETNRGCPFSCAFCDWGSLTQAKVYRFDTERLHAEIAWFGRHRIATVFCCDANFGLLPRDVEIAQTLANERQHSGYPRLVYTQTTKNAPERALAAQRILDKAGLNPLATLSVQTVTPQALQAIQRENIALSAFRALQKAYRQEGMMTYTDVLVGLPGETLESFMQGVGTVIEEGQHDQLRLWNVYLLPNAPMSAPAYRQKYGIQSVFVPYVNEFSRVSDAYQPQEIQEMLVGTEQMPPEDWALMRHFAWLVDGFYFHKLLQVPIMWVKHMTGHGYHHVLKAFMTPQAWEDKGLKLPLLQGINRLFQQHAQEILVGAPPLLIGRDAQYPEPTWMPAPYFMVSHLRQANKTTAWQAECYAVLKMYLNTYTQHPATLAAQQQQLLEACDFGRFLERAGADELSAARQHYPEVVGFYQSVLQGEVS